MDGPNLIEGPAPDYFPALKENLLTIFGLILVLSFVVLCVYLVIWVILYLHKYLQAKKFGIHAYVDTQNEMPVTPEPASAVPSSDFRKAILLFALASGSFLGLMLWKPQFSSFALLPLGLGIGYLVLWRMPK